MWHSQERHERVFQLLEPAGSVPRRRQQQGQCERDCGGRKPRPERQSDRSRNRRMREQAPEVSEVKVIPAEVRKVSEGRKHHPQQSSQHG